MSSRWLVVIAVGLVLAVGGFILTQRLRPMDVWLVNGLGIPLRIQVGGDVEVEVAASGTAKVSVRGRNIEVVARRPDGTEVDRELLQPAGKGPILFNVLGAAPLSVTGVLYNSSGITTQTPHDEDLRNQRVVERPDVDFWVTGPPVLIEKEGTGTIEKRELEVVGDWTTEAKRLHGQGRKDDAEKWARRFDKVHPELVSQLLTELNPPQPPPRRQKTDRDWVTRSRDGRAVLEQRDLGEEGCEARCMLGNAVDWQEPRCLAFDHDDRFITPDCRWAAVVKRVAAGTEEWNERSVIFIYAQGLPYQKLPLGQFIEDPSKMSAVPDGYSWLFGSPRMSADGRAVEFTTADRKTHRVPLTPGG